MKLRSEFQRALTLVELLVTAAVAGLLVALLLPALGRLSQNAEASKGKSNLRQVGVAIFAYASDNSQNIPPARGDVPLNTNPDPEDLENWSWQMHLLPYVEDLNVFRSPHAARWHAASRQWSFFLGSHAAGREQIEQTGFFDHRTCPPVNLARITQPARHILAGECFYGMSYGDSDKDDYNRNNPAFGRGANDRPVNILFADGHCEAVKKFDPTRMAVTYHGITDPPYDGYQ